MLPHADLPMLIMHSTKQTAVSELYSGHEQVFSRSTSESALKRSQEVCFLSLFYLPHILSTGPTLFHSVLLQWTNATGPELLLAVQPGPQLAR